MIIQFNPAFQPPGDELRAVCIEESDWSSSVHTFAFNKSGAGICAHVISLWGDLKRGIRNAILRCAVGQVGI